MRIAQNVPDAVGRTPLIKLKAASEATGCEIFGKAEFLNPGQSVKDRAALSIIRAAEADGSLRPGGLIVEGTAGNTGIGLALIGRSLGYDTMIVIPETQSQEKKGHDPPGGGGVGRGASRPLPQPEQLREILPALGGGDE